VTDVTSIALRELCLTFGRARPSVSGTRRSVGFVGEKPETERYVRSTR
jgi:hypothetical protein